MKRIIFAVFAHPDDEAFGPSGMLLKAARDGDDIHLITLTLGEAGQNPDNFPDLATVREKEWRTAGALIGAESMTYLGYHDGKLSNTDMIEIGYKLVELVQKTIQNFPECEINFVTNDFNGISGHIDHIVAARAAAWAFYTLKRDDPRIKRLLLSCITNKLIPTSNIDWLYMDAGRNSQEIDLVIDARHLRDEIIEIMRAHHTQREDGENHIRNRSSDIGLYSFIVYE